MFFCGWRWVTCLTDCGWFDMLELSKSEPWVVQHSRIFFYLFWKQTFTRIIVKPVTFHVYQSFIFWLVKFTIPPTIPWSCELQGSNNSRGEGTTVVLYFIGATWDLVLLSSTVMKTDDRLRFYLRGWFHWERCHFTKSTDQSLVQKLFVKAFKNALKMLETSCSSCCFLPNVLAPRPLLPW